MAITALYLISMALLFQLYTVNSSQSFLRLEDVLAHLQHEHSRGNHRSKFTLEITSTVRVEVIECQSAILPTATYEIYNRRGEVGHLGYWNLVSASEGTLVSLTVNTGSGEVSGVVRQFDDGDWIIVGDNEEVASMESAGRLLSDESARRGLVVPEDVMEDPADEANLQSFKPRELEAFHSNYLYQVNLHVDIDYELVFLNGGTLCNVLSYINSLFTAANVIFEKEVLTHLNVLSVRQTELYDDANSTDNLLERMKNADVTVGWQEERIGLHYALLGKKFQGMSKAAAFEDSLCDPSRRIGFVSGLTGSFESMGSRFGSDLVRLMYSLAKSFGYGPLGGETDALLYTFGGRWNGLRDINSIDSWINSPYQKAIQTPRQVSYHMFASVSDRTDECLAVPPSSNLSDEQMTSGECVSDVSFRSVESDTLPWKPTLSEEDSRAKLVTTTYAPKGSSYKKFRTTASIGAKTSKKSSSDNGTKTPKTQDTSKTNKKKESQDKSKSNKKKKQKSEKGPKSTKSISPTAMPTPNPSSKPSLNPTPEPTSMPTSKPTAKPSRNPTNKPTPLPTKRPTNQPTSPPTPKPTQPPTSSPTSAPSRVVLLEDQNICLTNPVDTYHTCFQRAVDPGNDLTEDTILRNKYNIGALLYERGQDTSSPSTAYISPYTPPYYVTSEEELTYGTVYLSLVRNNNTNLTCDDQIELEEVALEWLYDNVGSPDTFTPICVFNDGYALYNEVNTRIDGTQSVIGTAAFKMNIVFVSKIGWFNETEENASGRRLGAGNKFKCKKEVKHECCSADAINKSKNLPEEEKREREEYCKKYGCTNKKCRGRRKRRQMSHRLSQNSIYVIQFPQNQRKLIEANFTDTDFNLILGQYTDLTPNTTGAVLNATSVEDLAVCRASNYNTTEYDAPSLECGEYVEFDCEINDYIVVQSNETETNVTEYCLPDETTCNDHNLCTNDTWYEEQKVCTSVPVTCPAIQSCDPSDGLCKNDGMLVPCIAVIDEDDGYHCGVYDWAAFRTAYPDRPFCLLIPTDYEHYVDVPEDALNDSKFQFHNVTRDGGIADPDNWFDLCGLGDLNVPHIGLFVDPFGSMDKWTVKNSYNFFLHDAFDANLTICEVYNTEEKWIKSFYSALIPMEGKCAKPKPLIESEHAFSCFEAQKVRIELDTGKDIALFEVQVISDGFNVANGKSATQSSTLENNNAQFGAINAIDGDNSTLSKTDVGTLGDLVWWEVDLFEGFFIESVVINNTGCQNQDNPQACLCNMTDAQIFLIDSWGNVAASRHSIGDACGKNELWLDFMCHPSAEIGDNGSPNDTFPLTMCQSDCDSESKECAEGLECFERDYGDVPGCTGKPLYGYDYCIDRPANYLWYVGDNGAAGLLGKCEGDCDYDYECEGSLICFQRDVWELVPGCIGIGEGGYDYCYDPNDATALSH